MNGYEAQLQTREYISALSKGFERNRGNQLSLYSQFLSGFRKEYISQTTFMRMIQDCDSAIDNGNIAG